MPALRQRADVGEPAPIRLAEARRAANAVVPDDYDATGHP